ncbi:MFS transporter [Propionivibrio sp.]|uniref:MFS transporter n=1 Tax=Propionivibrio sp. TaxID=2212460 RepID=UPI0025CDC636|nr:MFS transporter [Propionivibrio sp.]
MWDILRQRRVLALFSACFSMSAAHGALYVFFSIFLSDHGYSKSAVGGLWSLGVLAEIAVFFYMSRLQRVYSLRTILLLSFSAAVLRFLMIGMGVELPVIIVLAQLLHGLTFGSFHAAAITAVNRWFPGRTRSRGQALYSSLTFGAGGLVGGLISGWTWDHLGGALTFALSSFFALVGLVLVTIWIPEKDVVMHRASAAI